MAPSNIHLCGYSNAAVGIEFEVTSSFWLVACWGSEVQQLLFADSVCKQAASFAWDPVRLLRGSRASRLGPCRLANIIGGAVGGLWG